MVLSGLFETTLGIRCLMCGWDLMKSRDFMLTQDDLKIIIVYLGVQALNKYVIYNDSLPYYTQIKNKIYV